jgi:hypothetical protein
MTSENTGTPERKRHNASFPGDKSDVRPIAVCRSCGASYAKYRTWQVFCSPGCRKAAWIESKQTEVPSDLRATLNRIEIKLDGIIKSMEGKS